MENNKTILRIVEYSTGELRIVFLDKITSQLDETQKLLITNFLTALMGSELQYDCNINNSYYYSLLKVLYLISNNATSNFVTISDD